MRLVLLGAPGSGKSTQARLLSEQLNIPQISIGDLLHSAVEVQTPLGRQAKTILNAGQHLPNELILGMIRERLSNPDALNGFILDDFPRNIEQARELDKLLNSLSTPIQKTILINIDFKHFIQRLACRLICEDCGEIFNTLTRPPALNEQCNKCAGKLQYHPDDNEESISQRMQTYETQMPRIIEFYKNQDKLATVDGNGEIKNLYSAMKLIFKSVILSSSIRKPTTPKKTPTQNTLNFTTGPEKKATSAAKKSTPPFEKPQVKDNSIPKPPTTKSTNEDNPLEKTPTVQTGAPENTSIKNTTKEITQKNTANKETAAQPKKAKPKSSEKTHLKKVKKAKESKTTKKSVKPKKTALKKKATPPKNTLQAQLKQLKLELKQVKAEITLSEKRNQALMKISLDNDVVRKKFSVQWDKDAKKGRKKK